MKKLDVGISGKHKKILQLLYEYETTKEDLEEYKSSRPLLFKIDNLQNILKCKDEEIYFQKKDVGIPP